MNVEDFTYLLQHPNKVVTATQTKQLSDVLSEFPYFQAARAVHLKGLKTQNSFKYNNALKLAAAYTTDRDILFDFITSKEFLQNSIADSISGKTTSFEATTVVSEEQLPEEKQEAFLIEKSTDAPLPQNENDAAQILDPDLFEPKHAEAVRLKKEIDAAENELEIGSPLSFTKNEKYSFAQWLQLTSQKAIERTTQESHEDAGDFELEKKVLKQKKFELIDKFISESPKIVPDEKATFKIDTKQAAKFDDKELMTETLAKVYLEQKKYKKAIQAYRILSLKYPEKSGFFADRIKAAEKIQQENP